MKRGKRKGKEIRVKKEEGGKMRGSSEEDGRGKVEKEEVPDDSKKVIIVPLNKGKGSRSECRSYRVISLSVPGKVFGRILIERVSEAYFCEDHFLCHEYSTCNC